MEPMTLEEMTRQLRQPGEIMPLVPPPIRPPAAWDNMSPKELIEAGALLSELANHPGWTVWLTLLEKYEHDMTKQSLRDPVRSKDYWVGQLDCLEHVRSVVETIIAMASAAQESEEKQKGVVHDVRIGGGPSAED